MCTTKTIATLILGMTLATKPKHSPTTSAAIRVVNAKCFKLIMQSTWNAGAISWCRLKAGKWQAFTFSRCARGIMAMLETQTIATETRRIIQTTGLVTYHLLNAETHLSITDCWFVGFAKKFAAHPKTCKFMRLQPSNLWSNVANLRTNRRTCEQIQ